MKDQESDKDIESLYSGWKESGLTQVAYCERAGISYSRFKNKRQKQRREESAEETVSKCGEFNAVSLDEAIEVAAPQPYCKITFSGGDTVSFSDRASLVGLKSLISDLIQL